MTKKYKKLISADAEQWKLIHKLLVSQGIFYPWNEYNPIEHVLGNDRLRQIITKNIDFKELIDISSEKAIAVLFAKLLDHIGLQCIEGEGGITIAVNAEGSEYLKNILSRVAAKPNL